MPQPLPQNANFIPKAGFAPVLHGAKLMPAGNTLRCSTWVLMAPNATADWSLEPPLCFTAGALPLSQPQPPKLPPLPPRSQDGCQAGAPWVLTLIPATCRCSRAEEPGFTWTTFPPSPAWTERLQSCSALPRSLTAQN